METQQTITFETSSSVDKETPGLDFEQLINETIDDIFVSLGSPCRHAIYEYLERKYELKKKHAALHMMEFSEALEHIFGDAAAALLEIWIMKELSRKVPQFRFRYKGTLTLPSYVKALSRYICKQEKEAEPNSF